MHNAHRAFKCICASAKQSHNAHRARAKYKTIIACVHDVENCAGSIMIIAGVEGAPIIAEITRGLLTRLMTYVTSFASKKKILWGLLDLDLVESS